MRLVVRSKRNENEKGPEEMIPGWVDIVGIAWRNRISRHDEGKVLLNLFMAKLYLDRSFGTEKVVGAYCTTFL